jgi:hypothetical protein
MRRCRRARRRPTAVRTPVIRFRFDTGLSGANARRRFLSWLTKPSSRSS